MLLLWLWEAAAATGSDDRSLAIHSQRCLKKHSLCRRETLQKPPKPTLIFKLSSANNASSSLPSPTNFQLPWTATVSVHIWKGHPWTICSWMGARCRKGLKASLHCLPSGFLSTCCAHTKTAGGFRWHVLVCTHHARHLAETQPWGETRAWRTTWCHSLWGPQIWTPKQNYKTLHKRAPVSRGLQRF